MSEQQKPLLPGVTPRVATRSMRSPVLLNFCIVVLLCIILVYLIGGDSQTHIRNLYNDAMRKVQIDADDSSKKENSETPTTKVEKVIVEKYYYPRQPSTEDQKERAKLIGETCQDIWKQWVEVGNKTPPSAPPKQIPPESWDAYTLFGRIPVRPFYFNEVAKPKPVIWGNIDSLVDSTREVVIPQSTYGWATAHVYDAMTHFKQYFEGKNGAVVGSQRPWCEVYALKHGAASMLTIEYQKIEIQSKYNFSYIHPFELANKWDQYKFDFVISFSSVEHSGLGRYGDPMDPWGDLREVAKMHCLLKPGGVFVLGFPVGTDALYWNAHRVYGTIRLPWILQGFKLLGVATSVDGKTTISPGFPINIVVPENPGSLAWETQPAIILQKL